MDKREGRNEVGKKIMGEEDDIFTLLEKSCHISSSQEDLLSNSNFARQDEFPSLSGDDWPVFSSSSSSHATGLVVTICSLPETPESHHKDDDDAGTTATTPQLEEEFKTPPEVVAPDSASSDDVVCIVGNSPEKRGMEKKSSDMSPPAKKLKGYDVLGLAESTQKTEETVVLVSDDDDEGEVEQTRNSGVTVVKNGADEGKGKIETKKSKESVEDVYNQMKFLMEALMKVSGSVGKGDDDDDDEVDILETAKKHGMTFPRSRWYGPE